MNDTTTSNPSDSGIKNLEIEQGASGLCLEDGNEPISHGFELAPLVWSEPSEPTEKIRYTHITAATVLGQLTIEWKGWCGYDPRCVYLDGSYVGVSNDMVSAKALAVEHLRSVVTGLLVAPPQAKEAPEPQNDILVTRVELTEEQLESLQIKNKVTIPRVPAIEDTGIRKAAIDLYTPPFRHERGYIRDANNHIVSDDASSVGSGLIAARIRGWGRIRYMDNPVGRAEQLQDEVGAIVAEALNAYWMTQMRA